MKLIKKISTLVIVAVLGLTVLSSLNVKKVNAAEDVIATFNSDDVVNNSAYAKYETTDWILTCGGNNKSVGSNSTQKAKCVLGDYAYVGAPLKLTNSSTYVAAAISKNKIANVGTVDYSCNISTGNGGWKSVSISLVAGNSLDANGNWELLGTSQTNAASLTFTANVTGAKYYALVFNYPSSTNFRIDSVVVNFNEQAVVPTTPEEVFANAEFDIMSQLVFSYQKSDTPQGVNYTKTETMTFTGSGGLSGAGKNNSLDVASSVTGLADDSLFTFTYNCNNSASAYIKTSEVRLYPGGENGSSFVITAENVAVKIDSIEVTYTQQEASAQETISADGKTATIQNINSNTSGSDNQVRFTAIAITYTYSSEDYTYTVDQAAIRFKYTIEADLYAELVEDYAFGFSFNGKYFEGTVEEDETGNAIVSVVVNNIPAASFGTEITAYAALVTSATEGVTANSIVRSVKSVAQHYVENMANDQAVMEHIDVLKYLSK